MYEKWNQANQHFAWIKSTLCWSFSIIAWDQFSLAHRIEFASNAIKSVKEWSADSNWIDKQKENINNLLTKNPPSYCPWISDHFMLMKNGELFVFYQGDHKEDNSINDMLVMKGSDGKCYFTDRHICIGMMMFKMYGESEFEDLKAVNEQDFELEPFSDEDKLFERAKIYRQWQKYSTFSLVNIF